MTTKKAFQETKRRLLIIKKQEAEIAAAYPVYCAEFPLYNKNGICEMIAEDAGASRATVWRAINKEKKSVYEDKGIRSV